MLFHISQPPATSLAVSGTTDPKEAAKKLPYHQQAINKASDYWLGLKAKPEGSWMRWFYDKGEGLMDKIEYEEWALKSVQEGVGVKVGKDGKIADADRIEVSVMYLCWAGREGGSVSHLSEEGVVYEAWQARRRPIAHPLLCMLTSRFLCSGLHSKKTHYRPSYLNCTAT